MIKLSQNMSQENRPSRVERRETGELHEVATGKKIALDGDTFWRLDSLMEIDLESLEEILKTHKETLIVYRPKNYPYYYCEPLEDQHISLLNHYEPAPYGNIYLHWQLTFHNGNSIPVNEKKIKAVSVKGLHEENDCMGFECAVL